MKLNRILSEISSNGQNIKECYKEKIERLLEENQRVLLITEDKSFSTDFKLKFVELLPKVKSLKQLILHPSKFLLFAWQGLINVYDYDIIIVNCEIKMDFVHAFRVFYIDNIAYDCTKPSCIIFNENPKNELSIYFQSTFSNEVINSERKGIKCFSIDQEISKDLINYAKCKRLLKDTNTHINNTNYKKLFIILDKLEKESIKDAIDLLKKCIDLSKVAKIDTINEDKSFAHLLMINSKILEIIEQYSKFGPIYIVGNIEIKMKNVFYFSKSKVLPEVIENSTIIILDESLKDIPRFKRMVFLKTSNLYPKLFLKEICKIKHLDQFLNYIMKKDMEYYTVKISKTSTPTLSWEHAVLFFEHILYQISRLFHENYLFIKVLRIERSYHISQTENKFYSCINFPKIVDNEVFNRTYKSSDFISKKDTMKDVSYKTIINLVETGYLDKNFLPVKCKFIDENKFYLQNINRVYEINCKDIEEAHKQINNIKDQFDDCDKFKRDFAFDLAQEDRLILDVEEVLRKQADALKNFSDIMSLYTFNDSNIGICTNRSFRETVSYKNTKVTFLKDVAFDEEQKQLILNFQVVFFGVNFRRITICQTNTRKYSYFVLPMKNKEIEFEYMNVLYKNFFFGSVYDVQDRNILNNFLLFNPVTKMFYEYKEESDCKLSDITNQNIKDRNYPNIEKKERTYLEYFTLLYGLNLKNIIEDSNIIFQAVPYSVKKEKFPELHAGEVIYVTTVKKSIKSDYKRFINYFNIFETLALVYEFKTKLGLSVSLSNLAISFTQKSTQGEFSDLGYERFEFIGDSVLKYSVSKFLFTECEYSLNRLVSIKDSLICNNHLYKIGRNIGIQKYFSFNVYSENLFQPPSILEIITDKKLIKNLCVEKVFLNNNQYNFVKEHSKRQTVDKNLDKGKKVYADIVESLIGVYYIEEGFDKAWDFIKKIGITKDHVSTKISSFNEVYLICDYEGILSYNSIESVEKLINYTFENKGYLEKAMIHPSYKNNMFGSERFQKLELIGDCFLDLKVSDYIYFKYTEANPESLHTHRKKLVNNHTFALILFKTGLYDFALTGLSEKTRDLNNNKLSKCYSDIFESLAGAVVLDCKFDMEKLDGFFKRALKFMLENIYDC